LVNDILAVLFLIPEIRRYILAIVEIPYAEIENQVGAAEVESLIYSYIERVIVGQTLRVDPVGIQYALVIHFRLLHVEWSIRGAACINPPQLEFPVIVRYIPPFKRKVKTVIVHPVVPVPVKILVARL